MRLGSVRFRHLFSTLNALDVIEKVYSIFSVCLSFNSIGLGKGTQRKGTIRPKTRSGRLSKQQPNRRWQMCGKNRIDKGHWNDNHFKAEHVYSLCPFFTFTNFVCVCVSGFVLPLLIVHSWMDRFLNVLPFLDRFEWFFFLQLLGQRPWWPLV